MKSHLNIFNPYRNKQLHWEDNLTRAFFILIKGIPQLRREFIQHLRHEQQNKAFGETDVLPSYDPDKEKCDLEIQTAKLKRQTGRILSVVITNEDRQLDDPITVRRNKARAVYDGVLYLESGFIVVVENKPSARDINPDQLNPALVSLPRESYRLVDRALLIKWADIFTLLRNLILNHSLNEAESLLAEDFLHYIDSIERFTRLKAFDTFAICQGNVALLSKRCDDLLTQLGQLQTHRGWKNHVQAAGICEKIALSPVKNEHGTLGIRLDMHPGNTMRQARNLHKCIDIDRLFSYEEVWTIRGDFHLTSSFGHVINCHAGMALDTAQYIHYWRKSPSKIKEFRQEEFHQVADWLRNDGILNEVHFKRFREQFIESNRTKLRVIPGLTLFKFWTLDEAIVLEAKGEFSGAISTTIQEMFSCWGQSFASIVKS